jgi:hypothetical protein
VAQASCRSHRPPRPSLATSTATATYSSDFWSNQQGYDIRNNTLSIEARPLNLLGSRVYDGSTLFQASDIALGNLVGAETLALSGSGSVANADASLTLQNLSNTGGLAIANGTNGGLASNYSLFAIGSTSQATIGQRVLDLTGGQIYDGSTLVAAGGLSLGNLVAGQTLNLSGLAQLLDSKNVGMHTPVDTSGLTLANAAGGGKASNYTLNGGSSLIDISARQLNVSTTGVDNIYDGNTNAVVTYSSDKIAGDLLDFSNTSSTFASKNVGTRAINVSGISLSGGDAGNYVLASNTSSTSADITPRTLYVTTLGQNKVYDGNTNAVVTYSSDKIAGDLLDFSNTSSTFASKNVGTRAIDVNGISLSGGDAGNYVLASNASSTSADITPRTLNVITLGQNKVYDGNTNALVTYSSDKISGDLLDFSNTSSTFASKSVGTRAIDVNGISLSGGDAGNYLLASTASSTSADITPRTLNVTTAGQKKVYDGNTNAVVTYSSDKIAGDLLDFSNTSSTFASKNVGSREIAVSGISLSGGDAGNYFLASTASSTSAAISPKSLVATAANDSKSFDGRPYSGGNGVSYAGFVAGDSAADIGGSPSYVGSSQGAYLTGRYDITPAGLTSLSGNYVLGYQLPIGSSGLRVGAAYFSVHYKLAREFAALLADGSAHSTSVYASYPFIRSQLANLNGTVSYENKKTVDNVASTATITGKTLKTTSLGLSGSLQDGLGGGGLSSLDLSLVTGKLDIESPSALALDAASARSNGSYEKFTWGASRLQQLGVWAADRFRKWETARFAARAVLQQS